MRYLPSATCLLTILIGAVAFAQPPSSSPESLAFEPITVGAFPQEIREFYTTANGLPDNRVSALALQGDYVYAATPKGLVRFEGAEWKPVGSSIDPISLVQTVGEDVIALSGRTLVRVIDSALSPIASLPDACGEVTSLCGDNSSIWVGCTKGLYTASRSGDVARVSEIDALLEEDGEIRQVACAPDGRIAVAARQGLFMRSVDGRWLALKPRSGERNWSPYEARGVAFDARGRLWFAIPQGVGCLDGISWSLYDGDDGLPYNDFTTVSPGENGVVWFGTRLGAIRFDGEHWSYRQGPSWVPDDAIAGIAVDANGNAWFATGGGVGVIRRESMTLGEKASYFSKELDLYNRRTPYGYVLESTLAAPGDKSRWTNHDSDNDGLWTAMYGAAECFRYAATKSQEAKERATGAFKALRFLSEVTQGGSNPAPPGFPARSILPTDGPNPNDQATPERDRETQRRDPRWKVIAPRWPVSADGKWYWKTDTSSDELDGHYFFYALYYDLVAETEEEKASVRETTLAITDHLIAHDYALVDHDGQPTRWAQFGPKVLNHDVTSGGRGLNSLSILAYLKVALHMSGDEKYEKAYRDLVDNHAYAMNTLIPKTAMGPGSGNQSDDEMAFMGYYHLLRYEKDPELLPIYIRSLVMYFQLEQPERCPLFNYIFAACLEGQNMRGARRFAGAGLLTEAMESLQRYRMDRIEWPLKNSQRLDVQPLRDSFRRGTRGHLADGRVLPIDERNVNHWNHDPWQLDYGGNGTELTDGSAFLLPYYMGLYHGFIVEK